MDSIDMILYQTGADDGEETQFYIRAVFDDADTDRYIKGFQELGAKLIDKFHSIPMDKFTQIADLTCRYKGPLEGFMKEFTRVFH